MILPGVYAKSAARSVARTLTNVFVNQAYGMYDYLSLGVAVSRPATPSVSNSNEVGEGSRRPVRPGNPGPAGHRSRTPWSRTSSGACSRPSLLLFIVSAVTFAIFFLVPRLAGGTAGDARHPLRRPDRDAGDGPAERAKRARLLRPALRAVRATGSRASSSGADYDYGAGVEHCPAPCFGYSFITRQPVWPDLLDRLPVTALAGPRRRGHLAALRRRHRRALGAAPRQRLRPGRDGLALAGVSLPIFFTGLSSLVDLQLHSSAGPRPAAATRRSPRIPAEWAYDLLLPWITLAFLFSAAVRPAHPGRHARDDERGLHPHRAGQGPAERTVSSSTACAPRSPRSSPSSAWTSACCSAARCSPRAPSRCRASASTPSTRSPATTCRRCMGVTLFAAFFVVLANLIVDLLYAVVDPRVRLA